METSRGEKIVLARQLLLLLVVLVFVISVQPTNGSTFNLQVGAAGDVASVGSMGVQAEIRTHVYRVKAPDLGDSFWVAINLDNGGGIQFGYDLEVAGTYCRNGEFEPGAPFTCNSGSDTVNGSEPTWFWEYWPTVTGTRYFVGGGLLGSAELNGTWHLYSIVPNVGVGWRFLLDGRVVANASFPPTRSSSTAYVTAEKVTLSTSLGPLGAVEFRNLAYLKEDGWHNVTALYATVNCGVNPNCIPIPYGVSLLGPNHIIAGSGVPQPKDGELLWSSTAQSTTSTLKIVITITPELLFGGLALVALCVLLVFEFVVLPRRKHTKSHR